MKFFTYNLISAANGWGTESDAQQKAASKRFNRVCESYKNYLDKAKPKVSEAAWKFFRDGNPENTLHDGQLLSIQTKKSTVTIRIKDYYGRKIYTFKCLGANQLDFARKLNALSSNFGEIYAYEIRTDLKKQLVLEFLLSNGDNITIKFKRLLFSVVKRRSNK